MWDSRCLAGEGDVALAHLDLGRRTDGDDFRPACKLVAGDLVPHLAVHVRRFLAGGRLRVELALDRPVAEPLQMAVAVPRIVLQFEAAEFRQALEALQLQGAEIVAVQRERVQTRQIVKRPLVDPLQPIVRQRDFLQEREVEEQTVLQYTQLVLIEQQHAQSLSLVEGARV